MATKARNMGDVRIASLLLLVVFSSCVRMRTEVPVGGGVITRVPAAPPVVLLVPGQGGQLVGHVGQKVGLAIASELLHII